MKVETLTQPQITRSFSKSQELCSRVKTKSVMLLDLFVIEEAIMKRRRLNYFTENLRKIGESKFTSFKIISIRTSTSL